MKFMCCVVVWVKQFYKPLDERIVGLLYKYSWNIARFTLSSNQSINQYDYLRIKHIKGRCQMLVRSIRVVSRSLQKKYRLHKSRCIFITTPFRLNRRSCLLSESGNATFRSYVQTTCISNWLIWKQKVCKTFLSSSRNISIIIVTQNSLKRVSWPIFWTKSVTL